MHIFATYHEMQVGAPARTATHRHGCHCEGQVTTAPSRSVARRTVRVQVQRQRREVTHYAQALIVVAGAGGEGGGEYKRGPACCWGDPQRRGPRNKCAAQAWPIEVSKEVFLPRAGQVDEKEKTSNAFACPNLKCG